jgi:hypothetical protein
LVCKKGEKNDEKCEEKSDDVENSKNEQKEKSEKEIGPEMKKRKIKLTFMNLPKEKSKE